MSEAELHVLRTRLRGGSLHKAGKGELRLPLPAGHDYDEPGRSGSLRTRRSRTRPRRCSRTSSSCSQPGR